MTREELRELVAEMRELHVTKLQTGDTVIELDPLPVEPQRKEDNPEFTATLQNAKRMKELQMLFRHTSLKPFKTEPK